MFNFQAAQNYELKSNISWVDDNYHEIIEAMKDPVSYHHCNEFFKNDREYMDDFFRNAKGVKCLEISPGICGALPLWKGRLSGCELIAVDPLAFEYDAYLKSKGGSWFDGICLIPKKAEDFMPEFEGKVDGFIFWRNGINHYEDPYKSIEVVSQYAAPGCRLFFWAEIQHADTPDAGHRNVTSNPQEVEDCILAQGWKLLYHTDNKVFNVPGISYGGVFEKV